MLHYNLSARRKSGHHGQVQHITMLKTILQFQPMISTFVEYSVMNILRHVWGRLATPGRFYSRWKTLKNENRAPVNQLLWTWKFGSRAPMLWVNTWCSTILHSLFHCHRPAHAHRDTCKINDLSTSCGARAAACAAGPLGHASGDGDAGYDALQVSATGILSNTKKIRTKYVHIRAYTYTYYRIHTYDNTSGVSHFVVICVSVELGSAIYSNRAHVKGFMYLSLVNRQYFLKCRWIGCYCLFRRGEYGMTDNFSIERAVSFNTPYPCNILMCRSLCNVVVLLLFIFVLSNLMWSIIWS